LKFNTKTRYGVRTVLEIALNQAKGSVFQKDIAEKQEISVRYLDNIIAALKTAGLISTLRGKKSGYILTRKPSEISIYDIHTAFEPGINIVDCLAVNKECEKELSCASKFFWNELNDLIVSYMKSKTIADMVEKHDKMNT
jgi:Rrf2 family transcriptional regulator, iron-sulfur cluster assembly transcription factor